MSMRYRTVTKVGKGQYVTGNYSMSAYILYRMFYYILVLPYTIIFKYCFYMPIKWCVMKLKKHFNQK